MTWVATVMHIIFCLTLFQILYPSQRSTDKFTIGAVPITKILWLGYGNSAFSTGVGT
jgi:hypothetical protein